MKKSDIPSATELFSGMPPLESVKAPLSLFVSHSQEKEKGKRTLGDVRHQPRALPWSTSAKFFFWWNSQMTRKRGSHMRKDTIWNTLAC